MATCGVGLNGPAPTLVKALTDKVYSINGCRGPTVADSSVSLTLEPLRGRVSMVL